LRKEKFEQPWSANGVVNFAVCGKVRMEECRSKKSCYNLNGQWINAGQERIWIDTQRNDSVSFEYINGEECGVGLNWKTRIIIDYLPTDNNDQQVEKDGKEQDDKEKDDKENDEEHHKDDKEDDEDESSDGIDLFINSIEFDNCSITIHASSSRILDKDITCKGGKGRKHEKGHSVVFWILIGVGSFLGLCCLVCCCCLVRRCRRNCQRNGQNRCRWFCKKQQFQPVPQTPSEESPIPTPYEFTPTPIMNPTPYPNMPFPMQTVYPTTFYYPPPMNGNIQSPSVPLLSVDPRSDQIEADEKLARSIQEQIN